MLNSVCFNIRSSDCRIQKSAQYSLTSYIDWELDQWAYMLAYLPSKQQHSGRIYGSVQMKRYCRQAANHWRHYTGVRQVIWLCCKAHTLAVAPAQVTWIEFQVGEIQVEFQVENRSFEFSNFV